MSLKVTADARKVPIHQATAIGIVVPNADRRGVRKYG
jgi:hypothetical protein